MRRYPRRTLLLMALALVAFVRLYYVTHARQAPAPPASPAPPSPRPPDAPAPTACRTLERELEAALRDPTGAGTRARRELDACRILPPQACELGAALDARAPLEQDAGTHPLRELLDTLCQRCPAGGNPCAHAVIRTVLAVGITGQPAPADVRWHLEHAGPGTAEACSEVVRYLLAPTALDEGPVTEPRRRQLEQLAPICARVGHLPETIVRAAAVQGDVPARAWLSADAAPAETTVLRPDRAVGTSETHEAFDGQESTDVTLVRAEQDPAWRKQGAASAVFEPPVRTLSSLRVKARGAGTVRAVVRVEEGLGLYDAQTQTSFLLPRVCHFRGTGQWEDCALPVALTQVEALSIFPDPGPVVLSEVDLRGAR